MNDADSLFPEREIGRLRRDFRVYRILLATALLAITGLTVAVLENPRSVRAQTNTDNDGILHVRGLVVEDEKGHERVRLGALCPIR